MLPLVSLSISRRPSADSKRVLYQIETSPALAVPPKRYRDFEVLDDKLRAHSLTLDLPGKLLLHSDSALEYRRKGLEAGLRAVVLGKTALPPPLEAFLHLHSQKPVAGDSSPSLTSTTPEITTDESDADDESLAAKSIIPDVDQWALEVLQRRARARERQANTVLLQRLLAVSSVLSLFSFILRRRVVDGLASIVQAAMAGVWLPRLLKNAEPLAAGFGMDDDALESSDDIDAMRLRQWARARATAKAAPAVETTATVATTATDKPENADVAALDDFHAAGKYDDAWALAAEAMSKAGASDDGELVWRVARACYYVTKGQGGNADVIQNALDFSRAALRANEAHANVHKWTAVLSNALGERGATRDRILGAVAFETHTKRALQLAPDDPTVHYLLGLFSFEISKLSWIERTAARAIAGRDPPRATVDDALRLFEDAMRLKPTAAFALEVGRCQWTLGRHADARETWRAIVADRWPRESPEDHEAARAAGELVENGM